MVEEGRELLRERAKEGDLLPPLTLSGNQLRIVA